MGVETARIKAIWEFQTSDLFTDAERAALNIVWAGSQSPNASTPEHFDELRKHYSNEQIIEILAVNCLAGWLNKWNDTVATTLEAAPRDFAEAALDSLQWQVGKHA